MNEALEKLAPDNEELQSKYRAGILDVLRDPAFQAFDYCDVVYELLYRWLELSQNGEDEENIHISLLHLLKTHCLFHRHSKFSQIAVKMDEMDHFMDKPFETMEGVNECGKCKSRHTISYGRQTRSGDEGMTVVVFCIECKHRFSMNS